MPDKKYVTNFMLQGSNQVWVRDEEAVAQISALDTKIDGVMDKTVKVYDTFASIPNTGLTAGDIVQTKGYYAINDGGASTYRVFAKSTNYFPSNAGYALVVLGEVTAKKCGAKGDGTTDDFSVLNSMVAMYSEANLEHFTYLVGDTLTAKSGMKLYGNHAKIKRKDNIGKPVLSILNLTNVSIEDVDFDGGTQSATSYMVSSQGCTDIILRGCHFSNSYGYFVRFNNHTNGRIEDCEFNTATGASGNPGGGVYAQGGNNLYFEDLVGTALQDHLVYLDGNTVMKDVVVHGCICRDGDIAGALTNGAGVVAYGDVSNLTITNCSFLNIKGGIDILPRSEKSVRGLTISNCVFTDINEEGIFIEGIRTTGMTASIVNCSFIRCEQDGISIRNTAGEIAIVGCVMNNVTRNGIELSNLAHVTITGCTLNSVAQIGIVVAYASGSVTGVTISGCTISSGNGAEYGVYVRSEANRTNVSNVSFGGTFATASFMNVGSGTIATGMPVQLLNGKSIYWGNAIPTVGAYNTGDIMFNSNGTSRGWRCTSGGAPGTWAAL